MRLFGKLFCRCRFCKDPRQSKLTLAKVKQCNFGKPNEPQKFRSSRKVTTVKILKGELLIDGGTACDHF